MSQVVTGWRFLGLCLMVEIFISPKIPRAMVRGMGVALRLTIWGEGFLSIKACLWLTPNLCCSSIAMRATGCLSLLGSWFKRAWVPMNMVGLFVVLILLWAVTSWICLGKRESFLKVKVCCSAKIWVGARMAKEYPCWRHWLAVRMRVAVLPEPVSPWIRRWVAWGDLRSW